MRYQSDWKGKGRRDDPKGRRLGTLVGRAQKETEEGRGPLKPKVCSRQFSGKASECSPDAPLFVPSLQEKSLSRSENLNHGNVPLYQNGTVWE